MTASALFLSYAGTLVTNLGPTPPLILVSHALCPYVQRAAIVLIEKGAQFERRWVDLAAKPEWFKRISPLGKTPVLQVGGEPLFESAVICEYLDETLAPRLHPENPLLRARHRAWMEFGSSILNTIAAYYSSVDDASLERNQQLLHTRFAQLEAELDPEGPFFAGASFGLVDAVFAPVFRYFDAFESFGEHGMFKQTPRVQAWRSQLAARPSVKASVPPDYDERLLAFLRNKGSALSSRMAKAS